MTTHTNPDKKNGNTTLGRFRAWMLRYGHKDTISQDGFSLTCNDCGKRVWYDQFKNNEIIRTCNQEKATK